MPNQLRFSLPGSKESIAAVRSAVASYANSLGFSMLEVEDISIAITEACKVICCHGHEGFSCRFLVVVGMVEGSLVITVSDNSQGFTIEKKACELCGHCPDDGDMAMFILSSLMDEAKLNDQSDGIRKLVMVKYL